MEEVNVKMTRHVVLACGLVGMLSVGSAQAVTVSISCSALGIEYELCRSGAQAWSEKTGNDFKIVSTPNSASERLALYQQILAAGAGDIDVYQIDVVWPGTLASHFVDLSEYAGDAVNEHFEGITHNNTINGRLVAMPWFTDAGLLYYRKDLLEKYDAPVPSTWQEMAETAARIQKAERDAGNGRMWGYVFQGRSYEGLTCNALEWVASYDGGMIVEADGTVSINNPQAAAALSEVASWIGSITPAGVHNYAEEESRGVFQAGQAVFMRNWPYAWALSQDSDSPILDKVGVSALPSGPNGRPAATLGGQQLAVSRYSPHVDEAVDLVMFLTSYEEQKRRAIEGSFNPTIAALYQDDELLAANPFAADLYQVFINAVGRPSITGALYNRASTSFYNAVHDILRGRTPAERRLASLQVELNRMSRGGNW
ncbi:MAG: ABC transporter substrate-binding protein [Aquisalimonadaceae bacterium]